jgi:hypothetical protein
LAHSCLETDFAVFDLGLEVYMIDLDSHLTSVKQLMDLYQQALTSHPNIKLVVLGEWLGFLTASLQSWHFLTTLCLMSLDCVMLMFIVTPSHWWSQSHAWKWGRLHQEGHPAYNSCLCKSLFFPLSMWLC